MCNSLASFVHSFRQRMQVDGMEHTHTIFFLLVFLILGRRFFKKDILFETSSSWYQKDQHYIHKHTAPYFPYIYMFFFFIAFLIVLASFA